MKLDIIMTPARGARRGTVVFLHGAGCWDWYWRPFFMPYFARAGYDAVAFSLRGHGQSEGRALINTFSIGDYARDLKSVVDRYEAPLIVGHSMGGFVTQAHLTRHQARGAVLLAAAAPRPIYGQLMTSIFRQPFDMLRAGLANRLGDDAGELDMLRAQMFSRGPDDTSMDHYLTNVQAESYRAVGSMMTRGLKGAARIKTPLLVIGAGRDRLVPPEAVALTGRIYRTTPLMFDDMSHMLMLEAGWRDVADAIIAFESSLLYQNGAV